MRVLSPLTPEPATPDGAAPEVSQPAGRTALPRPSPKPDLRVRLSRNRAQAAHLLERLSRSLLPTARGGRILHATFERTFVCNLRCTMCSQWGPSGVALKMLRGEENSDRIRKELRLEEWISIARQLVPHRSTISLTGGEPFVRPDSVDLVEGVSSMGLDVTVTTNGTLCDEATLARLAGTKHLRAVNFSLDGSAADHDAVRGLGNFSRTVRAAGRLAELRDLRPARWPRLEVRAATVLLPSSFRGLPELASTLHAAGLDQMNISPCRWFTKAEADRHAQMLREDFGIEDRGVYGEIGTGFPPDFPSEARTVLDRIQAEHGAFVFVNPVLAQENIVRYHRDLAYQYRPNCEQMYRALRVRADGQAIICPDQWIAGFTLGNLRDQSVESVWQGPRAALFRESFRKRGAYPGCARCCITNRDDS